jgi:hypothetical protein
VRLETGTASNGRAGIYFGTSQAVALAQLNGFATGGRPTRVRFRIRCLDNPRATEDFVLRLGFASNPLQAGGPSAGDAVMAYIDTEWRVVAPGTATINTDSWGDEVTGGWSWIEFYSDAENPNESTVSLQGQTNPIATYELDETASIPGSIFVQVEKLSGGSNRRVEVDYASLRVEFVR